MVHCKRGRFDVYVGRPSAWGNPFSHRPGTKARHLVTTKGEAIAAYERWLLDQPQLLALLPSLRGKVLGCRHAPLPCHGEVLARLADR